HIVAFGAPDELHLEEAVPADRGEQRLDAPLEVVVSCHCLRVGADADLPGPDPPRDLVRCTDDSTAPYDAAQRAERSVQERLYEEVLAGEVRDCGFEPSGR